MIKKPKKLWFKAKKYGWGWYPVSWQGWLVLAGYFTFFILKFREVDLQSHSASDTLLNLISKIFFLTLILVATCFLTGEKPEWRWRGKKIKF